MNFVNALSKKNKGKKQGKHTDKNRAFFAYISSDKELTGGLFIVNVAIPAS